ncbi:MAG TPA: hypothetical protein VK843_15220 [Planctomycetota bacterium]|nr:hypothetical protein [Planctomycetota bacterium]
MNHLALRMLLLSLLAAGGIAPGQEHGVAGLARTLGSTPLTAIYRTRITPEPESYSPTWLYTRSGEATFAGTDALDPRSSEPHAQLLSAIARECSPGGSLRATQVTADAFERRFTLHARSDSADPREIVEVWWSDDLGLPLVIVRERDGSTIVDELVHLEFEERSEHLARRQR